jgi:hypothetical protein
MEYVCAFQESAQLNLIVPLTKSKVSVINRIHLGRNIHIAP